MPFPSDFNRNRLRNLSVLLVLLAIVSVAVLVLREIDVRRQVFAGIVENKAQNVVREFDAFFEPILVQLEIIRGWGVEGSVEIGDADRLDARFLPLLRSQRWPAELAIATEEGFRYRLRRENAEWVRDAEPTGLKGSQWYRLAVTDPSGAAHATPGEDGGAALHLSTSWTEPESELARVIDLGVSRAALDSLIAAFSVTENGLMAIIGADATVSWYMPSRGPNFNSTDPHQLLHPDDEVEELLAAAVYAWSGEGATAAETFRFSHSGGPWWGWRAPFQSSDGARDLLLLIPERDLSDRLLTVTSPLTYGLLLLFGACVVLLFRVALGYRGRIVRMTGAATHSDSTEDELRALIDRGEGDHLEFKSTLRWNIRENRPGKEIELSWLKTVVAFLNTEGGTLLVGVADNGKIVGCEKDGFRNEDKYLLHVNNLIQRHIGVKYIRYIRYDLLPIDGGKILVVDVLPSDEPCFLAVDEDDQFYVRIGPASRKLSLRKTMEYLRETEGR